MIVEFFHYNIYLWTHFNCLSSRSLFSVLTLLLQVLAILSIRVRIPQFLTISISQKIYQLC